MATVGKILFQAYISALNQKDFAKNVINEVGNMWRCKQCSTKVEDQFENCWNCGADSEGNAASKEVVEQIKVAKIQQQKDTLDARLVTKQIEANKVVIVDIQIPFWSLAVIMLKFWVITAIFFALLTPLYLFTFIGFFR